MPSLAAPNKNAPLLWIPVFHEEMQDLAGSQTAIREDQNQRPIAPSD